MYLKSIRGNHVNSVLCDWALVWFSLLLCFSTSSSFPLPIVTHLTLAKLDSLKPWYLRIYTPSSECFYFLGFLMTYFFHLPYRLHLPLRLCFILLRLLIWKGAMLPLCEFLAFQGPESFSRFGFIAESWVSHYIKQYVDIRCRECHDPAILPPIHNEKHKPTFHGSISLILISMMNNLWLNDELWFHSTMTNNQNIFKMRQHGVIEEHLRSSWMVVIS